MKAKTDEMNIIHKKTLKILFECKKDLIELFELIERFKSTDQDKILKSLENLNQKEKSNLSLFIKKGKRSLKLREIFERDPKYIN
jgi:hypothetical protein